ncbi:DUF6089 family protein [Cyclobacteriaceae bacterium]|nr:DUF6089 family protein [Cyclobacteriaceae bacterium]
MWSEGVYGVFNIVVLRINALAANITGNEAKSNHPLPGLNQRDLSATLTEISALLEYNFFDFRSLKPRNNFPFCPYLFGGLGLGTVWAGESPAFVAIPFGAGIKIKAGNRMNLGFEFGARKTFTDKLDGITNSIDPNSSSNQDWYYFTGVSISYTKYYQKCPKSSPKSTR